MEEVGTGEDLDMLKSRAQKVMIGGFMDGEVGMIGDTGGVWTEM